MNYAEFLERDQFSREDLVALAHGTLVDDPPQDFLRLPPPPFQLLTRVTALEKDGNRGRIRAEQRVQFDHWIFQCHFIGDPVQPGCLTLDAVWGLVAIFCACSGGIGSVRALGCQELEFANEIRPHNVLVTYDVDVRRCVHRTEQGQHFALADARVEVDGFEACVVRGAKVGLFRDKAYSSYPHASPRGVGGG